MAAWVALAPGLLTAATLALWLLTFQDGPLLLFGGMIVVELVFAGMLYQPVQQVLRAVDKRSRDLSLLANVLERLERAASRRRACVTCTNVVPASHSGVGRVARRSALPGSAG